MSPSHPVSSAADTLSEALRVSESRYRRLFEAAQDGILLLNADTAQIEDVNPYLIDLLGYSYAEFLGKKLWEVGAFADRAESKDMFAELQTTGYVRYDDLPLKTKAGTRIEVEIVSSTYESAGVKVIQCNIRNITERKAAEAKFQRHTQLYAALSQCNQAIVHCASEDELFLQVCRAAVQFGGMKMAWIGLVDIETLKVRPVASFGDDTGYLKDINVSVDANSPFGCGPTGTAIREDRLYWCQDYLDDSATVPWQERATHAGLAAAAALPLHRKGVVIGAFTLYTAKTDAFDEAARDLLVEMAADISFALDNLAGESQRKQAEEEIAFKNAILKTQQETSLDAILVVDENGQIISYNQQFIALWQLPPQLVSAGLDAPVLQSVVGQVEHPEAFAARIQYLNEHRDDKSREEIQLKDGRIIDRYSAPSTGADGKCHGRVWYFRDITERKRAEVQVHELAEQLTTTLESITDAFLTVNREWRFTFLNHQAEQLLRRTRAELTGQNIWTEFPDTIGSSFEREFRRAMVDNHAVKFEALYQPLNSWFSVHAYPSEQGLAVYFHDISERKQVEDELRKSKDLLQRVVDHVPARIFWKDRDLRYLGGNNQFAKDAGYSRPDELTGKTDFEMGWKDQAELYRADDKAVLESGTSKLDFEEPQTVPDGSTVWLRTSKVPLHDKDDQVIGILGLYQDITAAKKVEEELRESERRFSDMLENVELISVMVDRDARITYCNEYLLRLTGWRREEVIGRNWFEIFVPPEIMYLKDAFFASLIANQPETRHYENEILTRSGERRLVRWNNSVLRSETGKEIGIASIGEDITERKRAEMQVHELAERLTTTLESVTDAFFTVDREWRFTFLNRKAEQLLRRTRTELTGQDFWTEFPDTIGSTFEREYRRAMADNHTIDFEEFYPPLNTWFGVRAYPSELGLAVYFQDITRHKSSERRLAYLNRVYAMLSGINTLIVRVQDREELFREACRVAVEIGEFRMAMIGIVDRGSMKIVPVASAGKDEALIGAINSILSSELASTTMVARAIREKTIIVSNDSQSDPQVIFSKKYVEAGVHSQVILPLIVADEAIGVLAFYATESNFFHEEELKLLTDLASDISYAMGYLKAEAALRSLNEELEDKIATRTADLEQARLVADQANLAKSSFLAAMSHEIRTPMNGVIGMIDVLHQTSLNDQQMEMVNLIHESAFALLSIIEDILDFSKIEAGRMGIEQASISLTDVVEKACCVLDKLAVNKNVELTVFVDPTIPEAVLGDELRLRQVLLNLIGNAIKFSSGRQQVGRVSVRAVQIEHSSEQVVVEIHVVDNGIGMDEATQLRLFTAFTQADTSITRRFGGTGLGLVISRHLVELMGGYFMFQSALGQGSTFTVRLNFPQLQNQGGVVTSILQVAGLSCLVVGGPDGLSEDHAVYLAHAGARVERASDLAQARNMMPGLPPGLWIWVIDAVDIPLALNELRALDRDLIDQEIRIVAIERGSRRDPRVQHIGLVLVDGNVLTRQRLFKAVAIAAGHLLEDSQTPRSGKSGMVVKQPSHDEALRNGRLILVAEDNETNQKVILWQLALLGFAADVADNGRLALERWQSENYALLLTDLQMPEMDGYALAAAIRAQEQGSRRIPIVALTANTLKGEAGRCQAAGMDDCLSKPLQLDELKKILDRWLPSAVSSLDSYAEVAPHLAADRAVDVSVLENLIGSDPAVILEFLNDFRISATKIGAELKTACVDHQPAQASQHAHKLKSSARTVGALALGQLCAEIEAAGKAGRTEALAALLPLFEQELDAVNAFLDSLQAQRADHRND